MITSAALSQPSATLHAAAAAARAGFNSGFYTTSAAVIPVLYLALTVQGPMLPGLLARLHKALQTMRQPRHGDEARPRRLATTLIAAHLAMTVAVIIVAFGVAGEICSLLALAHRQASAATQTVVFWSLVGLLLLTAAGPVWALNTAWVRMQWIPLRTAWRALRPVPPPAAGRDEPPAGSQSAQAQRPTGPPPGDGRDTGAPATPQP